MLPIPFGNPTTYAGHSGIDFPVARGTLFRASGHGRVRNVGRNARGGNFIWVNYDGYPPVGYHHMDNPSPYVRAGTEVWEGSPLGLVGSLGQLSTGPHLHSEVEGHATSSGYWRFFDRNRVVGQGNPSGGGGSTPGDDMHLDQNDLDNIRINIQRALQYEARSGGFGADSKFGPTLWERLNNLESNVAALVKAIPASVWANPIQAQDVNGIGLKDANGQPVRFSASGFQASTNAQVNDVRLKGISDAQVKVIADSVVKAIGTPTVSIDYAKIANDVRARFKSDPLS